ncbi:hypothetical protein M413DRAFT_229358 [Hebeloma cylindrosporum]|uniref:Uncharacterized protein n=1 Tax=Hebeloma cylindrosporum TaxID=76867 RepID=A0A0C3CHZ0_HEBCY|nr:hypothetical protein M413DRAFT_229358 [Hebeloma cylindrosporum h7]
MPSMLQGRTAKNSRFNLETFICSIQSPIRGNLSSQMNLYPPPLELATVNVWVWLDLNSGRMLRLINTVQGPPPLDKKSKTSK